MGECGLRSVLGEHRHAPRGTELNQCEPVGDAIQGVVDVGPAHRHEGIAKRDFVRSFVGQSLSKQRHRQVAFASRGGYADGAALRNGAERSGGP